MENRQLSHGKIVISKTKNQISFIIPHNKGEPGDLNNRLIISYISFFLVALMFPSANDPSGLFLNNDLIIRLILAIPIVTALSYFLFNYFFSTFGVTKLEINQQNFYLTYSVFGLKRKVSGATKDITRAEMGYSFLFGYHDNLLYSSHSVAKCLIIEGTKAKQFGRYIKRVEKEWLIKEINNFLDKLVNF